MVVEQKIRLGNSRASSAYLDCDKNHHPWDEDTARLYSFQLHFAHLCLRFRRQKLHFCQKVVCLLQLMLLLPAIPQLWHQFDHLIWIWNAPRLMFTLRASAKPPVTISAPPPLMSASYRTAAHARVCLWGGSMRCVHELTPFQCQWLLLFRKVGELMFSI